MKKNRMFWLGIVEVVIGAALIVGHQVNLLDEFWNGMGTGLAILGAVFLFRGIRYRTNEKYKVEVDTETNDERNKFLSMKAWSWAGYLFVMIAAAACIAAKIMGYDEYVLIFSSCICAVLLLFSISYLILRKKY